MAHRQTVQPLKMKVDSPKQALIRICGVLTACVHVNCHTAFFFVNMHLLISFDMGIYAIMWLIMALVPLFCHASLQETSYSLDTERHIEKGKYSSRWYNLGQGR